MIRSISILYLLFVYMFGCPKLYSQTVRSHIDKSCMKIGEQAHFRISAVAESSADVHFPPNDSILQRIKGIEILSTNDSISKYHTSVCRSRIYTITSFDPSVYSFSSLPVVIDGTLFKTGNISLTVQGVEIDTTHVEKIYDLKSAMRPPFSYSEWIWPLIISLVSLLLTILLIYIAIRIKDNKPIIHHFRFKPFIPPHKLAMARISELQSQYETLSDDPKTYYTELTKILRQYMQKRYGFNALEMTSDEIIAQLEIINETDSLKELKELFDLANLVKFAKENPDMSENDKNMLQVINYIQTTKKEEIKEVKSKEVTIEDYRSRKKKILLYTCIIMVSIILLTTVTYLIVDVLSINY